MIRFLLFLLLLATPALADDPVYTNADAERWRDAVRSDVESVADRVLLRLPTIRLAEAPTGDPVLALAATADEITLVPSGAAAMSATDLDRVMHMVVAHELATVLVHQHVDVVALHGAARTDDERRILPALIDGFGLYTARGVSDCRGDRGAFDALIRARGFRKTDPALAALRFTDAHRTRIWSILADPPEIFAQVRNPETLGDPVETEFDPERLFADLPELLDASTWRRSASMSSGEALLPMFSVLGAPAATVADDVEVAGNLQLVQNNTALRAITVFICPSVEAASRVFDLCMGLVNVQMDKSERLAGTGTLTAELTNLDAVEGCRAEVVRVRGVKLSVEGGGTLQEMRSIVTRRGRVVAQASLMPVGVDDETATRAIDIATDRVEQGTALIPIEPPNEDDPRVAALLAVGALLPEPEEWTRTFEAGDPRGLRALLAKGHQESLGVLERGDVLVQGSKFERSGPGRLVILSIITAAGPESARLLADGIEFGLREALDTRVAPLERIPGTEVEVLDHVTTAIDAGVRFRSQSARVQLPGKPPARVVFGVARYGDHILHLMSTDESEDALPLVELVRAAYETLSSGAG